MIFMRLCSKHFGQSCLLDLLIWFVVYRWTRRVPWQSHMCSFFRHLITSLNLFKLYKDRISEKDVLKTGEEMVRVYARNCMLYYWFFCASVIRDTLFPWDSRFYQHSTLCCGFRDRHGIIFSYFRIIYRQRNCWTAWRSIKYWAINIYHFCSVRHGECNHKW